MKFTEALDLLCHFVCCGSRCSTDDEAIFYTASKVLSENCEKDMVAQTTMLKSIFLDVEAEPLKPVRNHTHGKSAAARSTGSLLIDRVATSSGLQAVYYQGSSSDLRHGRKISRSYFWAKDFMAPPAPPVNEPELVAMVDVDYYVDMEKKLLRDFTPHLLYTFQPSCVCRDDGEYKYTFDADNRVHYMVSGGGHYVHKVWNWTGDSFRVVRKGWLGMPLNVATYAIERRRLDDDHQLILLAPLKSYSGLIMSFLANHFVAGRQLDRLSIADGPFTRLTVNDSDGLYVCTGTTGGYCQARVPVRADDAIASAARTMGTKLTLAAVKSKMENASESPGYVQPGAEVLLEYHLRGLPKAGPIVSTLEEGVRRFQWVPPNKDPDFDAKPGMVAFMKPLFHGGFVPDSCYGNDQRAANERVLKIKEREPSEVTNFISDCMDEFVHLLFKGRRHFLDPVEIDEVYARQDRPAQRRILDNAQHENSVPVCKNFVKREAYPSVNDPRMISTINGHDKLHYSSYIYALTEVIKQEPWYAFSKTPLEIAQRVSAICSQAEWVDLTDFSRMDGRVGYVAREFERRLAIAAFKRCWTGRLLQLMRSQYMLSAKTTFGVRYDTGLVRCSGSPETSSFNTVLNAFIAYMGYRRTRGHTGYLAPETAYEALGIYGGDDGFSGGMSRDGATRSARSVGQVLELVRVRRGDRGVAFLARRYGPDVWYGDSNSCCDIKRQLAKFHLTVALPSNITRLRKLQEKCFAFSLSDANTPIIGRFVRAVLKMHPYSRAEWKNVCGLWRLSLDSNEQYPNRPDGWMDDIVSEELPGFDIAKFEGWIEQCEGCGNWFEPPAFAPIPPAKAKPGRVVVDNDLVGKDQTPSRPSAEHVAQDVRSEKRKARFRSRKPKTQRPSRKKNPPSDGRDQM